MPLPPAIRETFLVREHGDDLVVRIFTIWKSRKELDEMRAEANASGVKPKGVQILEAVGAEPRLSIHEVLVHHSS